VKPAVREYLAVGRALEDQVQSSLLELCDLSVAAPRWEPLEYFHAMLAKHLDLVARRLLNEETIPAHEKVFSLFEPHTEWIKKGKQRPNVELGHKLLLATSSYWSRTAPCCWAQPKWTKAFWSRIGCWVATAREAWRAGILTKASRARPTGSC
jgi:hypothetical protein